jgi:arsenite methyltransferase
VLIFEAHKAAAFLEFHRVLRPGGRLSLFEPINRYSNILGSLDPGPVGDLLDRVGAIFEAIPPRDSDPMLDFDERDLVSHTEAAGFDEIHLELRLDVRRAPPQPWATVLNVAANPLVPTLAGAMRQALTAEEIHRLSTYYLKPSNRARPRQATHSHRLPLSATTGRMTRNRRLARLYSRLGSNQGPALTNCRKSLVLQSG